MHTREKLSWTLLGVALFFGIAAVSTDTSFFKNISSTGWLSLSGETNRLTVANDALELDGTPIGGGESLWTTNSNGWITPAGGDYKTNTLVFKSGLADDATNVAALINTAATWTGDASLLKLANNGTAKVTVNAVGGVLAGRTLPAPGGGLSYSARVDLGDPDAAFLLIQSTDEDSDNESYASVAVTHDSLISDLWVNAAGVGSANQYMILSPGVVDWGLYADSSPLVRFQPTIASGTTPFVYDTASAHVAGNIAEHKNNGSLKFSIDFDGTPAVRTIPGITTTWTNMIDGVITQRITAVGGIIVTNLTL